VNFVKQIKHDDDDEVMMMMWWMQCSAVAEANVSSWHFSAAATQCHSALRTLSTAAEQSHPGTHLATLKTFLMTFWGNKLGWKSCVVKQKWKAVL